MKKKNEELRTTLENVQQIISAKRYDEARAILEDMDSQYDNPTVKKWLSKLDEIAPKDPVADMAFPDIEKPKKKPGCVRRTIRAGGVSLLFVCACIFTLALMSDSDSEPKSEPTTVGQITIPSVTPEAAAQSIAILIPTATIIPPTPINTLPPTNTPMPTSTRLPTNTPMPTNTRTADDEANLIQFGLSMVTDIDVQSVEITDGRANGGERGIIMSYTSHAEVESDFFEEWGFIFGAVGATVREYDMDIDALSIVIGDEFGGAVGVVIVDMQDVLDFLNEVISVETFFERIQLESF